MFFNVWYTLEKGTLMQHIFEGFFLIKTQKTSKKSLWEFLWLRQGSLKVQISFSWKISVGQRTGWNIDRGHIVHQTGILSNIIKYPSREY